MTRLIFIAALIAVAVFASSCLNTAEPPEDGEQPDDTPGYGNSDVNVDDVFSDGDVSPPQIPPS